LLVVGLLTGQSGVLGQLATGRWAAGVSAAQRASIERRRRRRVHDAQGNATTCSEPAVRTGVNWSGLRQRGKPAVLALDAVLARVAARVPSGLAVSLTADQAVDIPPFSDRSAAQGWPGGGRLKANGSTRFRDQPGREHAVTARVDRYVAAPGHRWTARGRRVRPAGWRPASSVAVWAPGAKERLVVGTDLPPT
jgi:hypothetical protein